MIAGDSLQRLLGGLRLLRKAATDQLVAARREGLVATAAAAEAERDAIDRDVASLAKAEGVIARVPEEGAQK